MSESLPSLGEEKPETLYHGSKHYWKARCHVDFTLSWYKSKHIIEVANFNVDGHEEGERIFINPDKLFDMMVDKAEVESKVRAKQEEMMRQRKPRVMAEELAKTITAQMAVHSLIQRAVIVPANELPEGIKFAVKFAPQTGDLTCTDGKLQFITERPEGFIDTPITRNKKATNVEFRQTLATLKNEHKKLSLENNRAARKAGLAKSAVEAFTGNMRRYTYDPETQSPALIRFLKAGRRIIALNTVRKVTDLLERLERKSMGDLPSPTRVSVDRKVMETSTSLPTLSDMNSMGSNDNGRRVRRMHHRLKPVRKGAASPMQLDEEDEDAEVASQ